MTEGRDDQIELLVRRDLAAHLADSVYRGVVPVGVAVLASSLLLWGQVHATPLRIWMLIAAADLVRMALTNRVERRVVASGQPDPRFLVRNAPNYLSFGVVWGSL